LSLVTDAKVAQNKQVIPDYFRMTLAAPSVAELARPGQFLHVRCGGTHDPLLRRPISIHAVDRQAGEVYILYRVAGKGTAMLAERRTGERISIIGPLGRGFTIPGKDKRVFAVSGGIGIAPLYFLLQELAGLGIKATLFQGFATAEQILLVNEIRELGHNLELATDDGTMGFHGSVTKLFENHLQKGVFAPGVGSGENLHKGQLEQISKKDLFDKYNRQQLENDDSQSGCVFACGPYGMLKKVGEITAQWEIPCEVSMEERMGCGVGACLSCACKIKTGDGGFTYRRVCKEGPVFPSGEVVWE
jgi:dihydroorotate dehydrogenase electron transfer subunit